MKQGSLGTIRKTELDVRAPDAAAEFMHRGIISVGLDSTNFPCVWYWAALNIDSDTKSIVILVQEGEWNSITSKNQLIGRFNFEGKTYHAFSERVWRT